MLVTDTCFGCMFRAASSDKYVMHAIFNQSFVCKSDIDKSNNLKVPIRTTMTRSDMQIFSGRMRLNLSAIGRTSVQRRSRLPAAKLEFLHVGLVGPYVSR